MGTKDVKYFTSRWGTLILWIILVSSFLFLAFDKHYATLLWGTVTVLMLAAGFLVARTRAPELKEIAQADTDMDMILRLAESDAPEIHLFFRRSEEAGGPPKAGITFTSCQHSPPLTPTTTAYQDQLTTA
jgi:hypothetical protein